MKTRIHVKSKPINIQKLIDSLGAENAAISLGVTSSAVKKYIRMGKAPKASEIAAQSLLGSNNNTAIIIHGSADLLAAVRAVADMGGGRVTVI